MPPGEPLTGAAGTEFPHGHLVLADGRIAAAGPALRPASRAQCAWTAPAAWLPRASSRRIITCSSG